MDILQWLGRRCTDVITIIIFLALTFGPALFGHNLLSTLEPTGCSGPYLRGWSHLRQSDLSSARCPVSPCPSPQALTAAHFSDQYDYARGCFPHLVVSISPAFAVPPTSNDPSTRPPVPAGKPTLPEGNLIHHPVRSLNLTHFPDLNPPLHFSPPGSRYQHRFEFPCASQLFEERALRLPVGIIWLAVLTKYTAMLDPLSRALTP